MTTAVLDGDIIAYQAAAVAQKDIDWGDDETGPTVSLKSAESTAHRLVLDWTKLAGASDCVIALSDRDGRNFRNTIFPTYKHGRKSEKPLVYWQTIAYLEKYFKVYRIPGLEADDVMGLLGTSERFGRPILVSLDKDLQTVPALIFNPNKDRRPRRIREELANHFWMTQTLTGDSTDCYPGLPGVGPKNAERILSAASNDLGSMWEAVEEAYIERGLTRADAVLQARLARILRRQDYDKTTETIYLWHPTKATPLALASVQPPTKSEETSDSSASVPKARRRVSRKSPTSSRRKSRRASTTSE